MNVRCAECKCNQGSVCMYDAIVGRLVDDHAPIDKTLHSHLLNIASRMERDYKLFSDEDELQVAMREIRGLGEKDENSKNSSEDYTNGLVATVARRTFLLQVMRLDPDYVQDLVGECPRAKRLVEDMNTRILPLIFPRFLENMCQDPQEFVRMAVVLHEMWQEEPIDRMNPYVGEEKTELAEPLD